MAIRRAWRGRLVNGGSRSWLEAHCSRHEVVTLHETLPARVKSYNYRHKASTRSFDEFVSGLQGTSLHSATVRWLALLNVFEMAHTSNIKAFLSSAISSENHLIQAYCGLVAIELTLKDEKMCAGHNVPDGIRRLGHAKGAAIRDRRHRVALVSLAVELINDLRSIHVLDKDGNISTARAAQFPDIRYTRFSGDGWGATETPSEKLEVLAKRVSRIRSYLRTNFGYAL